MIFEVRRRRRRGVPLSQEDFLRGPAIVGDLRVEECGDLRHFGRTIQVATLHSLSRTRDIYELPPLYDVRLAGMAPLALTLTGVEFEGGAGYVQTWWCVGRSVC